MPPVTRAHKESKRPMALAFLVGCLIGGAILFLSGQIDHVGTQITTVHGAEVHNCNQIEALKTRIRIVTATGLKSLGTPGSPGYSYYRDHPTELAQARLASQAVLQQFAAAPCR